MSYMNVYFASKLAAANVVQWDGVIKQLEDTKKHGIYQNKPFYNAVKMFLNGESIENAKKTISSYKYKENIINNSLEALDHFVEFLNEKKLNVSNLEFVEKPFKLTDDGFYLYGKPTIFDVKNNIYYHFIPSKTMWKEPVIEYFCSFFGYYLKEKKDLKPEKFVYVHLRKGKIFKYKNVKRKYEILTKAAKKYFKDKAIEEKAKMYETLIEKELPLTAEDYLY